MTSADGERGWRAPMASADGERGWRARMTSTTQEVPSARGRGRCGLSFRSKGFLNQVGDLAQALGAVSAVVGRAHGRRWRMSAAVHSGHGAGPAICEDLRALKVRCDRERPRGRTISRQTGSMLHAEEAELLSRRTAEARCHLRVTPARAGRAGLLELQPASGSQGSVR
jgi:hypothetical protein